MKHHEAERFSSSGKVTVMQDRCRCGWKSNWLSVPEELDAELREHHKEVREGRARMTFGAPSLVTQARTFRANSESSRYTDEERRLWAQLATELERRVDQTKRDDTLGQDELF